jgi:indole-3-glycerol phosphate synthase
LIRLRRQSHRKGNLWSDLVFKGKIDVPDSILDEIVASKHRELAAARYRMPLEEMEYQVAEAPPVRDFLAALSGPGPIQLIAEVKKASPSAKVIREDFDPIAIARTYQAHGAACLSVLTDAPYFQGHLSYLARIRAAVAVPLLRKDFIIDEYQVVEARLAGADAVLLIAEILDDNALARLQARARDLGMAALVEFHDEANLPRVLDSGATLVGVNNRDLKRFVTDLDLTLRLRDRVPPGVTLVSESGIRTRRDVERLEEAGVHAILVGETLMRADDIGLAVERLLGLAPEAEAMNG